MRPGSSIPPKSTLGSFISYLKDYLFTISLKTLLLTTLFVATLVLLNYTVGIEKRIREIRPLSLGWLIFFLFYSFVFFSAWGMQYYFTSRNSIRVRDHNFPKAAGSAGLKISDNRIFLLLLLLAPAYFACKMIHWDLSFLIPAGWHYPWDKYTLTILQLPAKLVLLLLMLTACRKIGFLGYGVPADDGSNTMSGLGMTTRGFLPLPYLFLLLLVTPLVALASTQPDFLHYYPKVKSIAFINGYAHPAWPWKLLYEISYGLDFVSIELFFRGLLVLGLARWAGSKAILPMAAFYCTVHFGKPLGECISSFFGGLILGVLAFRTRSILGGLMVHLGLAWMMEIGGWLGGL
jgi:hypothetical protein